MHLTTVGQTYAVFHEEKTVHIVEDLEPGQRHKAFGIEFLTLPDLGERLSTFATTNDVHFGEAQCGVVSGQDMEPVFSVSVDETPYTEVMNACAIKEILAINPDAVLVKGDLTCDGTEAQHEVPYKEPNLKFTNIKKQLEVPFVKP